MHHKPQTFTVTNENGDLVGTKMTLEQVADLTSLDPDEIEWAIEEHGEVSTDQYHVVGD